jgi:hypothetical protein
MREGYHGRGRRRGRAPAGVTGPDLAVQLDVRLVFDRGTLLLRGSDRTLELADVPGLLWDPRVRAYRAPAWRHAEVASALAARGVRFSDDVRCRRDPAGRWQDIALREYQARALDAWDRGRRRGVVVLPTGSGKTRVALAAMAKTAGAALCLVPTRVLLDQWCSEIATVYGGRPVGRFGDGARQVAAITVSTYESALRYMDVLGNRFDLLVLDEVTTSGPARTTRLSRCAPHGHDWGSRQRPSPRPPWPRTSRD